MPHTNTKELNKIPLGSGDIYVTEWTGEIPANADLEKEENLIGRTKNGATITYSANFYTAKSDDGKAQKTKLISEEASLSYGMITWNAKTLVAIIATARETGGAPSRPERVIKIGGIKSDKGKSYLLRFVYKDPVDGDIRITMVGKNTGGWSAAFTPSTETTLQPSFQAEPQDDEGTLILYEEEKLESSAASLASVQSSSDTMPQPEVMSISSAADEDEPEASVY